MRFNKPVIGFILGALMPMIGFLVVFLVLGKGSDLGDFLSYSAGNPKVAGKVLGLAVLANILPFMIFTNRRLDYAARGVFIATMLYAVLFVLIRFVW